MEKFDDYTADTDPELKNPERGMYFGSRPNTPGEFHTIVPRWLWLAPWCNKNLVWDPINPGNTSEVLKNYGPGTPAAPGILESARLAGYKILFRPRYDQRDPDAQEGDPPGGPSDCKFEGGIAKVFHADSWVVRRYVGGGALDEITALEDESERRRQDEEATLGKEERERLEDLMAPLDELCEAAEVLAHAARSMAIQIVHGHLGEI